VASASADGEPYLVPLSFDWDGEALLVVTPTDSPTGRNLATTRAVRLGLDHTRWVNSPPCRHDLTTSLINIPASVTIAGEGVPWTS
jgi:nitroimidazol reductase NimA-like FMN-containing flavoprotein (pyridoxamine 5'-phosphate oxidase superfamily)